MKYKIAISAQKFEIEIGEIREGIAQVNVNGEPFEVLIENYAEVAPGAAPLQPAPARIAAPAAPAAPAPAAAREAAPAAPKVAAPARAAAPAVAATPKPAAPPAAPAPKRAVGKGEIIAPIPGRIMAIKVQVGSRVSAGQTVVTMEAMKMENNIISPVDGTVQEIRVQKDSEVATGQVIMVIG
ncbi:MAG: acetyl-CoA carboxylase biotin carboxyl carrier protein subunit [Desulfobacterales bacterium]|uniref:Acetyl-CoA carboxylase biotin carboxyl carrier protein subunit n=1 Tax=Candidatus Desulfatibia profunda TaxID=2841695 RepID=A0A8J6NPS9_9BACT|nr:acetyl-CoA carboxylase biotin carboxyl carrier protein subunit [Candidatus Desulfatibia profunda]MBL7180375.1 acetyl-CoA carboxylase biotin carboxyl carrier protein subunit [Desulfobacterales bacterium]